MNGILEASLMVATGANILGVILIIITRLYSNDKKTWAGIGIILIIIALGNAAIFKSVELNQISEYITSLFGLVVLGSLGVRLFSNWLTEEKKTDEDKKLEIQIIANTSLIVERDALKKEAENYKKKVSDLNQKIQNLEQIQEHVKVTND